MQTTTLVALLFLLLASANFVDPATEGLVKQIAQKVKHNADQIGEYGYLQSVTLTKFGSAGQDNKRDERTYRTIWIQDKAYNELLEIDRKPLSPRDRQEEVKRFADFLKSVRCKANAEGIQQELRSIPWWKVRRSMISKVFPHRMGQRLFFRSPETTHLEEHCRFERILNHLEGVVWLDQDLNEIKVEAKLTEPVRFGLGIIANVESAQIKYTQQQHGDAWLPADLSVSWSARIALFSHRLAGDAGLVARSLPSIQRAIHLCCHEQDNPHHGLTESNRCCRQLRFCPIQAASV